MAAPRIVFLVNVDWFFCSHFLYLARRAKAEGYDVSVASFFEKSRDQLAVEDFDLLPLTARRSGKFPTGLSQSVGLLRRHLSRTEDVIIHGFGFFGIVVGTIAAELARRPKRVFTITGRGHSASAQDPTSLAIRVGSRYFCSKMADGINTRWLAENSQDITELRLQRANEAGRVAIVGGAGIDPDSYPAMPLPSRPPLRIGLVSRAVWSKGIDIAVEAVSLARQAGANVELTIAGEIDAGNPGSFTRDEMCAFAKRPGVRWLGRVEDIPSFWREHHIGMLPSRGGEGVPRSLIEAGSYARPLVSTSVAGCRELINRSNGWLVPPDDPLALRDAILQVEAHGDLTNAGNGSRRAVLNWCTEELVWQSCKRLYQDLAATRGLKSRSAL